MTSMRRRYVASTSLRRHVPAGNLAPPWPPQNSKPWPPNIPNLPTPMKPTCDQIVGCMTHVEIHLKGRFNHAFSKHNRYIRRNIYRIFPAIRRGFRPSRMTSNNLISPMKFCYNTNYTLPKQCQSSRSVLQDGSRTFGLFWKEKKTRLITEEIR